MQYRQRMTERQGMNGFHFTNIFSRLYCIQHWAPGHPPLRLVLVVLAVDLISDVPGSLSLGARPSENNGLPSDSARTRPTRLRWTEQGRNGPSILAELPRPARQPRPNPQAPRPRRGFIAAAARHGCDAGLGPPQGRNRLRQAKQPALVATPSRPPP